MFSQNVFWQMSRNIYWYPVSLSTLTQDGGQDDNNMHKNHGISRLDSFIMYVKKDLLQLLTDC